MMSLKKKGKNIGKKYQSADRKTVLFYQQGE